MKHNGTQKSQSSNALLNQFLSNKIKIPLFFLFFILFTTAIEAQNSVLYLTWDTEVDCQVSSNPRDAKSYLELIEDGECLRACQGATVVYTLHGQESNWQNVVWDVAGGTIISLSSNQTVCIVQWSNGTVGSIGATINTNLGSRILPDLCIELIKKPKAQFWKAPFNFNTAGHLDLSAGINVCAGENFTFENGSIANGGTPIVDYYWEFGDGTTSTEFEPSHTYTNSGMTYDVFLTVTNACNCKSTQKLKVHVGKKSVNIVCPAVVCEGQSATYSIADLERGHCDPFDWSVEGGIITSTQPYTSSIDVLWTPSGVQNNTVGGFGYVSFNPSRCGLDCYVDTHLKIPVITDNMRFTGPTSVCGNSQNRYTMPQWPTTDFVWEVINDGSTNATVIYTDQRNEIILNPGSQSGAIILRVTYQNTLLNCGGTSEQKISIKKDAAITGPLETCLGSEVQYNLESGESVNWTLKLLPNGPTTQFTGSYFLPTFSSAGNYSLTVSNAAICSGEAIIIKVRSPLTPVDTDILDSDNVPNARIVCPSAPSTFSIPTQVPGTIVGWSIPTGVGTIVGSNYGNEIQVIFNYPTVPAGTPYTLNVWRETTTNPACKSAELTINLAPEDLDLTISGQQHPCGSTRQTYELPANIIADTFEWTIADPEAGSIISNGGRIITVLWNQFASAKLTSISVKVTKCNIPKISAAYAVTIDNPRIQIVAPTAPFCPGVYQPFSITSSVSLSVATNNVIWDFGDGTGPDYGENVSHQFSRGGTFTIRVRVIEPNGCLLTLTETTTVVVSPRPTAMITPSIFEVCSPNPVNVSIAAQPGPGVTSLTWYQTGNSTPLGTTNSITATSYGEYYIEISNGTCTNTINAVVVDCTPPCVASPIPNLGLTLSNTCTSITAQGTITLAGNPTPTNYYWDSNFIHDDVIAPTDMTTATFSFEEPGDHTITYGVAYNNQACFTYTHATVLIPYIAKVATTIACGTNNNYSVTMTDESLVASGVTLDTYIFKLDGVEIPLGAYANSRVIEIPGGVHTITMTISGGIHPPCTIEKTIDLPAFPNATFTATPSPVCQENSTLFAVNHVPGQTYFWDFGDGTFNLQQNPEKEYNLAGPYQPELRVTNAYCYASFSSLITVKANKQDGRIANPPIGCPGGSSTLSFTPSGTPISTSFQWLRNNQPIPGATTNPFTVWQSGSYSIAVGVDGCTKRIPQSVPVAIAKPPFTSIQGPATVCENVPFTLFVKAGSINPGVIYEWRRTQWPNLIWSTLPTIIVDGLPVGAYTYTLTIKTPLPTGGFCTTLLTHTVTVVEPAQITAYGTVRNCEPFEVKLTAQSNQSGGTFNWSNGGSGNLVYDTNGGAFMVTYTSEAGCKTSTQFEVPKNLDNYMWIFPYGCYTFCSEFTTGTLIGPSIAYFDKWDWLSDTHQGLSGSGLDQVLPYDLGNLDATYNLQLETSPCKIKSKDMIVDIIDCECEVSGEFHSVDIKEDPFIHYRLTIFIANTSGADQAVLVTVPNEVGVLTPSFVNVPDGGGAFTFMLIPETFFNGGTFLIKFSTTDSKGRLCKGKLELTLPPWNSSGGSIQNTDNQMEQSASKLTLVPNPAATQTQLHYDFGTAQHAASQVIEVYDLYGRQLDTKKIVNQADVWHLNTATYQVGIYIVVMKQDGKIVQQKNLIIAH